MNITFCKKRFVCDNSSNLILTRNILVSQYANNTLDLRSFAIVYTLNLPMGARSIKDLSVKSTFSNRDIIQVDGFSSNMPYGVDVFHNTLSNEMISGNNSIKCA